MLAETGHAGSQTGYASGEFACFSLGRPLRQPDETGHATVRLLVNNRKFSVGNSIFLSHQTSQQ